MTYVQSPVFGFSLPELSLSRVKSSGVSLSKIMQVSSHRYRVKGHAYLSLYIFYLLMSACLNYVFLGFSCERIFSRLA